MNLNKKCNICETPFDLFLQFSTNGPKIRCPNCLSFERHRRLEWAYKLFIEQEFSFDNKEILSCVPSRYETEYLFKNAKKTTTFDIRPVDWFDMQLDITDMSSIEPQSYDAFVAIAVLQHVKNDHLVASQVHRILRPGGRCFFQASNFSNEPTKIASDIHQHYTTEEYERYGVGTYRIYNSCDLIRLFQDLFLVKTFYGIDPITGASDFILCGIKE